MSAQEKETRLVTRSDVRRLLPLAIAYERARAAGAGISLDLAS
jgi:hypothetical protein